jgi:hypothetical protein
LPLAAPYICNTLGGRIESIQYAEELHIDAGDVCNSDRDRIPRFADSAGLGLAAMGSPSQTANRTFYTVVCRVYSRHGLSPACGCSYDVRPGSPLSILRPSPASDISMRGVAFPWRNRFRDRRCVATEFITLARASFSGLHADVLDNCRINGVSSGMLPLPKTEPLTSAAKAAIK